MKCSDFASWLDEGSPERDRSAAMRHAAECAECSRALEAARAVEAMLRSEAVLPGVAAPAGFVAGVMARVEDAAARARDLEAARPRVPWWGALASDPVSIVSVTLGFSLAALAYWHPAWLLDAGFELTVRWWALASSVAAAGRAGLDPLAWLSIAIALAPLAAWGLIACYRRLERAILLVMERPR